MTQAAYVSQVFADALTDKFKDAGSFSSNQFSVEAGRKYDRIVADTPTGGNRHVHAFVERATGGVFKAAGWNAPAKGERYATIGDALERADLYGSYLYAR